jgi:hypothetical protein
VSDSSSLLNTKLKKVLKNVVEALFAWRDYRKHEEPVRIEGVQA